MAKRVKTMHDAKLAVAQVYWDNDQACKDAKRRRDRAHDLAIMAIGLGETVGPIADVQGAPHWLSHGERESVIISPYYLQELMLDPLEYCTVDVGRLREEHPEVYGKLLKHRSTERTKHSVLTWADRKPAAPKRRVKRS